MAVQRFFLSDNASGIHPRVLEAIAHANRGHAPAYGLDPLTRQAQALCSRQFGEGSRTLFVQTGTAANVLALQSVLNSYESVICARTSHLHLDECGAPEKFTGSKLLIAEPEHGKLIPDAIAPLLVDTDMVHRTQPRVVSVAQCTEWGTVYRPEELQALADFCHGHNMLLHLDGARLCYAAAALGVSLGEASTACGVDLLSFGGTKVGAMNAEAVVFADRALVERAGFYRKQAMQLTSKMRFIAAQFTGLLEGELWRELADHANRMAAALADAVASIQQVEVVAPVETNVVFARIPKAWLKPLQAEFPFALWDSRRSIVRWMTSFDTCLEDVEAFTRALRRLSRE